MCSLPGPAGSFCAGGKAGLDTCEGKKYNVEGINCSAVLQCLESGTNNPVQWITHLGDSGGPAVIQEKGCETATLLGLTR